MMFISVYFFLIIQLYFRALVFSYSNNDVANTNFQINNNWWKVDIHINDIKFLVHKDIVSFISNKFANDDSTIYLSRNENISKTHSCYNYVIVNDSYNVIFKNIFCYPSVIVGGIAKVESIFNFLLIITYNIIIIIF